MIFLFCEWFVIFEFYNNTEDGGMVMKEIMIETKALKKYYQMANNVVKALDGVDLQIGKREFVAIIGKSGSGKSTLLHMLGGLDIPSSGKVIIDGEDLSKLNHEQLAIFRRRKVGFVFQQYNLIPDLNVYENVVFPLQLDGRHIDDEFIHNIRKRQFYKIKQLKLPAFKLGGKLLGVALYKNDKPQINLNLLGLKIKFHYKKSPKDVLGKFVSTVKTDTHKIINICGIKIKIRRNITAPSKKYTLELKTDGRVIADVIQKHLCTLMLHQKNFAHYKNFYNGKDVVVCGAGPSLQYYSPLPDCIHIATNRAFLYDRVKFNYLFTQDWLGIQHLQEELINYKGDNCIKFLGTQSGLHTEIPESFAIRCNAQRFNTDNEFWPTAKFAVDISTNPFGNFHTIVLTALQFVLYTNPKRIYIVGCDSVPSGHFNSLNENEADKAKQIALQQRFHDGMFKDWQKFKNFVQIYYPDTEIISVNPVKLKGLFRDVYTQEYLDANKLDASGLTILTEEKECLTR